EALGALTDAAITEADLTAGRYDAAEVRIWLVNWADPSQRAELFRGTLGEVSHQGSAFRAELRGLSEALNRPVGRAYSRDCSAVLGDNACIFDLDQPGFYAERAVETVDLERRLFGFASFDGFTDRWFEFGRVAVLSRAAAGLTTIVRSDRLKG